MKIAAINVIPPNVPPSRKGTAANNKNLIKQQNENFNKQVK